MPAGGEVAPFLRWLHPDAVVVDSEEAVATAAQLAQESDTKLIRVPVHEPKTDEPDAEDWAEPVDDPFDAIRELSIAWTLERLRRGAQKNHGTWFEIMGRKWFHYTDSTLRSLRAQIASFSVPDGRRWRKAPEFFRPRGYGVRESKGRIIE